MKPFSKKDYVILSLAFALLFILSSFGMIQMVFNTEAYYALAVQQPIITALSIVGYALTAPVLMMIMMPLYFLNSLGMKLGVDYLFMIMPLFTATLYSLFIMIGLAMFNNRKLK